jgi:hypothetical protein
MGSCIETASCRYGTIVLPRKTTVFCREQQECVEGEEVLAGGELFDVLEKGLKLCDD